MRIRRATDADLDTLAALWRAFEAEVPAPLWVDVDSGEELGEIAATVRDEIALIAEDEAGGALGFALARLKGPRRGFLSDLYVRPEARRAGVARALVREAAAALRTGGAEVLELEVIASNAAARAVYARWGFRDSVLTLAAPLDELESRLALEAEAVSFGSIHVQTDEVSRVERAVREFVPRLRGGSRGSIVAPARNGWVAVYDDACDREPAMLRRLARELSDRMGAVVLGLGVEVEQVVRYILFDRGGVVDEYLSVPEFYGPLPPGDAMALGANPTVVSRLAGADREALRSVARTASSPAELPPARELLAGLAAVLALEGAEHGFAGAPEIPGATRVER